MVSTQANRRVLILGATTIHQAGENATIVLLQKDSLPCDVPDAFYIVLFILCNSPLYNNMVKCIFKVRKWKKGEVI